MNDAKLQEFLTEYDAVTTDVLNANSTTFETNLERWFEAIESAPLAERCVRDLESTVDFPAWRKAGEDTTGSFVGSGQLRWPKSTQRIGMQVALFRAIANGSYSYDDFSMTYFGGSTRFDDMVNEITRQVFDPMSRDLRRHLVKVLDAVNESDSAMVAPASDRSVRLDHNSADYKTALQELEKLEGALNGLNDYPDMEDKQRRVAEVGAARRLLAAVRVAVDAIISIVYRSLRYIAKKFTDTAIGVAATALLAIVGKLTGLW